MLNRHILMGCAGGASGPLWSIGNEYLEVFESNLKLYYPLHDLVDIVGGHNLTNNNSVSFSSDGIRGKCATLSGANHLSVANHSDFQFGTGAFAISCWINTNQSGGIGFLSISNENFGGIMAFVETTVVKVLLGAGTVWVELASSSGAITQDAWNHILIYREGENVKVRANDTEIVSLTAPNAFDDVDADLCIGRWDFVPEYYTGMVDEVAIWKGTPLNADARTALSAGSVRNIS